MTNFKEEVNVDDELKTCCDYELADVPYERYSKLKCENMDLKETVIRQANEITELRRILSYWENK